ncbi:hemagglutinin repeat-containing protein, partial [Marinospirillum sp.]|uniref:hemagglutinin repeat-containing protein n=1 Tax=Marinospirillum sp. TaxID=2183934 RepID=UPI0028700F8F
SHYQADGSLANTQTLLGRTASILGEGVSLITGDDLNITGADVHAGQNLQMNIGGDAQINALKTLESRHSNTATASQAGFSNSELDWKTSSLSAGGNLELNAKGDLASAGTDWKAGSDMLLNAKDITLSTVTNLSESYQHLNRGLKGSVTKNLLKETVIGNLVQAGGNLVLSSVGDIASTSTQMLAQNGTLALFAGNDVILDAETERDYEHSKKSRKSDGMLSSTRRTSTSTRETTKTLGNKLSAQDIQIQAGGLAHLHAAQLDSENNIAVSATDIAITSGIDQTYKQDTATKKTTFRRHTSDRGSLAQTAAGSELNAANIQLQATGGIQVTASDLNAGNDLTLGNLAVEQQADGSFKAVNGEGTPEQLVVDTLELRNEDWNHKTKSYRGAAATVAKAATVIASATLEVLAPGISKPEITLSESSSDTTTRITQQNSEMNAGNNLVMAAKKRIQVIAGELSAEGNAILSADNISLDAAEETHTTESTRSRESVGGVAASVSDDEITLGGMELNKETRTERTTSTTHQGSSINAGNLVMLADQDISILASDVKVKGDAVVQAEGDITIGGRQSETVTETHEETETTRITAGVRNAYVDTAQAAVAVKDAAKALEDAHDAYRDARRRVERGELTESALKDYETNRAAATAQLAQATLDLTASGASAAAMSGNGGFYASANAETTATQKNSSTTEGTWQGSNIEVGGSATVSSGHQLNLQGSELQVGQDLNLHADQINILAGVEHNHTTFSEQTDTASGSISSQSNGAVSANTSTSRTETDSQSNTYVNSRISANNLNSTSQALTLAGAEVEIQNNIDITTGQLTLSSVQNTREYTSTTQGGSAGASLGGAIPVTPNSVGVNHNETQASSQWVDNQSFLTGGGQVNITADKTDINGATLASATRNQDGSWTDQGNLTLITDELNVTDLQDHNTTQTQGINLNVGLSKTGSSTLGLTDTGHNTEQTTSGTLGTGTVQRRDGRDHELADSNRDLNASQAITQDQQTGALDASVTVDHRLVTEEGRALIKEDFAKSDMILDTLALMATTERVGALDFFKETGIKHTTYEGIKSEVANNPELAQALQNTDLSAADKEIMLNQLTYRVMQELGYDTAGYENTVIEKQESIRAGFYSEEAGNAYINNAHIGSTGELVTIGGHELSHAMDDRSGNSYSDTDKETYANNFGSNLSNYTDLALGINGYSGGMAKTNNPVGNNTPAVMENTAAYNQLDKSKGDNYLTPDQQKAYQLALQGCTSNKCQAEIAQVYETLDDQQEVDRRIAQIQQVGDNVAAGAQAVYDAVTSPIQTAKDFVAGIGNLTPETIADGLKQAADSQHQNHLDRAGAYVAGDSQALGQAEGNIATENLGMLSLPGGIGVAGKVANATGDVLDASKAGETTGFGGNNGSFHGDAEMVGQDGSTYTAVVHTRQSSDDINQTMIDRDRVPAWTDGSTVDNVTLLPGYKVEQIVDSNAQKELAAGKNEKLGGWASNEPLPNTVQAARDVTGVKKEWKNDDTGSLYVVEIEVTAPVNVNRGSTRHVYDEQLGRELPGKITQLEFKDGKVNTANSVKVVDIRELEDD